ncbi:MAG: hypothetical protein ACOCVG_03445 [Verrucomicrobiota bacterium]
MLSLGLLASGLQAAYVNPAVFQQYPYDDSRLEDLSSQAKHAMVKVTKILADAEVEGLGFAASINGRKFVVTTRDMVEFAQDITIQMPDDTLFRPAGVAWSRERDVAILTAPEINMMTDVLEFADSETVEGMGEKFAFLQYQNARNGQFRSIKAYIPQVFEARFEVGMAVSVRESGFPVLDPDTGKVLGLAYTPTEGQELNLASMLVRPVLRGMPTQGEFYGIRLDNERNWEGYSFEKLQEAHKSLFETYRSIVQAGQFTGMQSQFSRMAPFSWKENEELDSLADNFREQLARPNLSSQQRNLILSSMEFRLKGMLGAGLNDLESEQLPSYAEAAKKELRLLHQELMEHMDTSAAMSAAEQNITRR